MGDSGLDIRLVEDFLDLCKTGNFSETAENRFVTQPTLSRRIKQLEDWLGAPLIERQIRPVRLTEQGVAFFPIAEEMHHWVTTAQGRFEDSLTTGLSTDPSGGTRAPNASETSDSDIESPSEEVEPLHVTDVEDAAAKARKIMLVDDSETSLMVLAKLVEDEGHDSVGFLSGEDALEAFQSGSWDMAICDYRMPGIDGARFTDRVREVEARGQAKPLPVVGVSTSTDLDSISNCFRAGMNDYMCKPVGINEMRVVLDRWLPQSRTLEATELDALNDNVTSGLGDKSLVASFCNSMRPKVKEVAEAIECDSPDVLKDLLPTIRDEAYMVGAYSFARTCIQLSQTAHSGSTRKLLEKRGPFLCEFVRLESALDT